MKKNFFMLCFVLVCCCLSVSATETDEVKACESISNGKQVCTIIKEDGCECVEISIDTRKIESQNGAD